MLVPTTKLIKKQCIEKNNLARNAKNSQKTADTKMISDNLGCAHRRLHSYDHIYGIQYSTEQNRRVPSYPSDNHHWLVNIYNRYMFTTTTSLLLLLPRYLHKHLSPNIVNFHYAVWSVLCLNKPRSSHLDLITLQADTLCFVSFTQLHTITMSV